MLPFHPSKHQAGYSAIPNITGYCIIRARFSQRRHMSLSLSHPVSMRFKLVIVGLGYVGQSRAAGVGNSEHVLYDVKSLLHKAEGEGRL